MELFTIGFPTALSGENLLYCFIGVFLGTFVGVLPGIGSLSAISLILPLTFNVDPGTALVMLAGIYYGTEYGGSTASILLNLPGTTANAVTCLDGYPMSRNGRAGVALAITTISSFVGGSIGIMVLILLTPAVVALALSFGPAEYLSAMALGLLAAASMGQGAPLKGVVMVILGLMLGCIGADVNSGIERFTFGRLELFDGINIAVLAMGLFGVAEIISSAASSASRVYTGRVGLRSMIPTRQEARDSILPTLRGTAIGSFFGCLPGTGPTLASFISYAVEKRVSRHPEKFGKGAVEGIASPEAANNAAVQTAFVPTLALGVPGSATMAVMLAALSIQGITPGPDLMTQQPQLYWGLVASFWIGNVFLLALNIPFIGIWVRLLKVPYELLYPCIIVLVCIGAYSVHSNVFDVFMVMVFGVVGYGMRLLGFEPAPLLMGFILGPMMEENFRRALLIARGDYLVFIERPLSGAMIVISLALLAWMLWKSFGGGAAARRAAEGEA